MRSSGPPLPPAPVSSAATLPPSALELESLAEAQLSLDRRLLAGMGDLRAAEAALQQALSAALEPLRPPPVPAGWLRLLAGLGLVRLDPPPSPPLEEELWRRHERALEAVRALGHHLETLDRELVMLQGSMDALEAQQRVLSRHRAEAAARATAQEAAQADAWAARRAEERFRTAEERIAGLLAAHHEVRSTLREVVGGLDPLYRQGGRAMDALSRQITSLAAQAAVEDRRSSASVSLQESLGELILATELQVSHTGREMDALSGRLGRLDEEAQRRAAARAEVDRALVRGGGRP